jgi:hypothetical protein
MPVRTVAAADVASGTLIDYFGDRLSEFLICRTAGERIGSRPFKSIYWLVYFPEMPRSRKRAVPVLIFSATTGPFRAGQFIGCGSGKLHLPSRISALGR